VVGVAEPVFTRTSLPPLAGARVGDLARPHVQPLAGSEEAKLARADVEGLAPTEKAHLTRTEEVELGGAAESELARPAPVTLAGAPRDLSRRTRRAAGPGRRMHRNAGRREPGAMDLPHGQNLALGSRAEPPDDDQPRAVDDVGPPVHGVDCQRAVEALLDVGQWLDRVGEWPGFPAGADARPFPLDAGIPCPLERCPLRPAALVAEEPLVSACVRSANVPDAYGLDVRRGRDLTGGDGGRAGGRCP